MRPPPRPRSPRSTRSGSVVSMSHGSQSPFSNADLDTSSRESSLGELVPKRHPYIHSAARPATAGGPSTSTNSLQNFSRPTPARGSVDGGMGGLRSPPPALLPSQIGHRPRQHSQGFFEPSLPHASSTNVLTLGGLNASQIAAQAAMHHVQSAHQERKRSGGSLVPPGPPSASTARRVPSPIDVAAASTMVYSNGTVGGGHLAATTAANVAFPRSPLPTSNAGSVDYFQPPTPGPVTSSQPRQPAPPVPKTQETKTKERSKMNMKLFSKPKNIGISNSAKESDKKHPSLPSPSRGIANLRGAFPNMSTTSLADTASSSTTPSIYSSANASTSTLVPTTTAVATEKEKEKHRHHFLSRQKQKLKETAEHRSLPLSSASSNSQAVDPSAPQSLYSFAPPSPGFSKSVSGLDLRHGGRALREKKKEEKAAAAASSALSPILSNSSFNLSKHDDTRSEYIGPNSLDSTSMLSPATGLSSHAFFTTTEPTPMVSAAAFGILGAAMGINGITPDDAWPLLKARLLNIFEGEDLRTPIEDFNLLVSVHVRRCIQKRAPVVLIEDLRELLVTGFSSLAQTLRGVPDERLVPKLVEMWVTVIGTILPFIQAVFLPLDLELRGQGPIMSQREAAEFWGPFALDDKNRAEERPASSGVATKSSTELDVRRISLIAFRDVVVLPKHESLMAIFSRLSLDSIRSEPSPGAMSTPVDGQARNRGISNAAISGAERPGTGGSLSPRLSSFNSQASTLLDAASNSSGAGLSNTRSRATSNTSAGSFGTSLPHLPSPLSQPPMPSFPIPTSEPPQLSPVVPIADPAHITETVARMLQCASVLAGVQTGDQAQGIIERLTQALKYNWLGRGRTGRQRRGWVGMKVGAKNGLAGVVGA